MASREKSAAPPKRLPPAERREQLTAVALEVAAERGYRRLELEEVAERAGVARTLSGRTATSRKGGGTSTRRCSSGPGRSWRGTGSPDESIPLSERLARNFVRIIDHAAEPSDAWRLYRVRLALGVTPSW